jgi:TPP-dependent pyruvate/acetoin dehydrogenase alpha subunit
MEQKEELLAKMYYRMNQARFFEEKVSWFNSKGKINGSVHLAIGQEASSVASCLALDEKDFITMTHRCHAQAIGQGMDVKKMMAELLGKETGYCQGKGGSLHLSNMADHNVGSNDVPGMGYNLACGIALAQILQKTGNIVLCFGGDGSTNEGDFHEALNLASVKQLPVIFFIENNYYSVSTAIEDHMKVESITDRAAAYEIPAVSIDGNDALEVYDATQKAAEFVRSGEGPMLIESCTYRMCGHDSSDLQLYRSKEEMEEWSQYDPIANLKNQLKEDQLMTDEVLRQLEENAKRSVNEAADFAENAPEPSLEAVLDSVYA